jgi:hypothetical protein
MSDADEFGRLAAEYAAAHAEADGQPSLPRYADAMGRLLPLHRAMFAAMGGADEMSADVPGGRVTATVSRHSFRPGFRFDVAVEPAAAPAGVAVTDDDGSTD